MKAVLKVALMTTLATGLMATTAWADAPRVVSWNINGGEQDKDILAQNANDMRLDVGDFDILVLQEVISSKQVAAIAEELGFEHWAMSDFSAPVEVTGKWYKSLEVAIISRKPFKHVAEWDTTGPEQFGDKYDPRASDTAVPTESLALSLVMKDGERPSRGFLRTDFENGLSVYAVHWKSSGGDKGDDDLENAARRENNARGVALDASRIVSSGGSVLIAGDYNIQPFGKHVRVGTDVAEDCVPSQGTCKEGGADGYDDSMQILSDIGNGYRLLSTDLVPTYIRKDHGPGAIDHIAVAGSIAAQFERATTVSTTRDSYFGSDHIPVMTGVVLQNALTLSAKSNRSPQSKARAQKLERLIKEVRERLDLIEQMANERR